MQGVEGLSGAVERGPIECREQCAIFKGFCRILPYRESPLSATIALKAARRCARPGLPKTMKAPSLPLIALFALGGTCAHAVPLAISAEADVEVSENYDTTLAAIRDNGSAGDAASLNVRFSPATAGSERNEVIVLRFNLAGYNRSAIASAGVRLINHRAATASQTLRIYGVNDGATGRNALTETEGTGTDDNWPETGATFSTTPGLEFDGNGTTRGVRFDHVTDLGTGIQPVGAEGASVTLSTNELKDFLVNHPDDKVTILVISESQGSGQKRFASKEATVLNAGGTAQPAGTYAPQLVLDLPGIRVPASADSNVSEQNNGGSGGGTEMNARFNPVAGAGAGNNEILALRFDLTGNTPSDILGADLKLVNQRDNSASTLHYYGVVNGATGYNLNTSTAGTATDNDWAENTNFASMPGLEYDGSTTTAGVRTESVVDLGTVVTGTGSINTGTKVVLSNAALTSFLKNHADSIVTILVKTDTSATGQKRFTTREATTLNGGVAQPVGTYAPEINLLMANSDRDGDLLLNNWETLHGLNPDNSDSNNNGVRDDEDDFDGDFLTNVQEQTKGTKPLERDTDGDGLWDGYETGTGFWMSEFDTGTNPLVADTDGDGLSDGVENPGLPYTGAGQPGTDPNRRDSDHDLYSDGAEVARNSDPTVEAIVPGGAMLEILGTGSNALLDGPVTDPDNNINDSTPAGADFNWKSATASEKAFFGTGNNGVDPQNVSGAFDLFDHKVGVLNDKWLAGGLATAAGAHVTVELAGEIELTHFTIASADDRPERDPVDWEILGSTDGSDFTPIFTQTDGARVSIWTSRNQVVKCTLAQASPKYRYLRFHCSKAVADNSLHLNEIEYFGNFTADPVAGDFKIVSFSGGPQSPTFSLTWASQPGQTYRIGYSTTLGDNFVGTAAQDVAADAGGTTTTHVFTNPQPGAPRLFFRVEKP